MSQLLNIKLIDSSDCGIVAVDSTRIALDANSKIDRAFIEFVVYDGSVVFNTVNEVAAESQLSSETSIPISNDGLYKYYKLAIPTLDYYKAGDSSYNVVDGTTARCFYYQQKIYKPDTTKITGTITVDDIATKCTKISSVSDMWDLKDADTNILYYYEEYFSICRLINCFLNRFNEFLSDYLENQCTANCSLDMELEIKKDFLMSAIFVLKWLICNKQFDEAEKILDRLMSCDSGLCPEEYISTNIIGGCGCGKS